MSIAVNGILNIGYIFKLQGIQTVQKEAAFLRQPHLFKSDLKYIYRT